MFEVSLSQNLIENLAFPLLLEQILFHSRMKEHWGSKTQDKHQGERYLEQNGSFIIITIIIVVRLAQSAAHCGVGMSKISKTCYLLLEHCNVRSSCHEHDYNDERAEDKQGWASGIWDIWVQVGMLHTVSLLITISLGNCYQFKVQKMRNPSLKNIANITNTFHITFYCSSTLPTHSCTLSLCYMSGTVRWSPHKPSWQSRDHLVGQQTTILGSLWLLGMLVTIVMVQNRPTKGQTICKTYECLGQLKRLQENTFHSKSGR